MKSTIVSASLLMMIFLWTFPSSNGQTFQYSRGWTNGKRSDPLLAYAKHTDSPWNPDEIASNYRLIFKFRYSVLTWTSFLSFSPRQWELSRILARLSMPPMAYHVYAYDLTPSTTTTPASIQSRLYQRPQVKHELELNAPHDLLPANSNEDSDRFKRKSESKEILA